MYKTGFSTMDHGFHFSNNDITWSFALIRHATFLCGGMSYAALDYFHAGLEIPQTRTAPAEGTPLQQYIYERQVQAHVHTVPRFGLSWTPIIGLLGTEGRQKDELHKIVQFMKAGEPIPICLVGGGFGHHVVAIGLTPKPFAIDIYDPNVPENDKQIIWRDGHYVNTGSSKEWRGFFVDDGYSERTPRILEGESDWRLCYGCRSLFRANGAYKGMCACGGAHVDHFSANYTLVTTGGHGQKGWRRCSNCTCLFYAGDPSTPGWCADGTMHNGRSGKEYTLAMNVGAGQGNWFWCQKCQNLFFYGSGQYGKCSDGQGHDPSSSGYYYLPFGPRST
jgi:hypothetical protein